RRMTLTLPVLDAASRVVFLVVGSDKAATLATVLQGKAEPPLPAQMVQPRNGSKMFLVDRAAAAQIETAPERTVGSPAGKGSGTIRTKPGRNK
ncbi:MAG TPA: 6-phosphogluconolactonase, partial [Candidatus Binatia bacterium]|nr:6-phosphogluconolactonase [Candidatus Binatia bacterium]